MAAGARAVHEVWAEYLPAELPADGPLLAPVHAERWPVAPEQREVDDAAGGRFRAADVRHQRYLVADLDRADAVALRVDDRPARDLVGRREAVRAAQGY